MASFSTPLSLNFKPLASSSGKKEISAPIMLSTFLGLAASPFNNAPRSHGAAHFSADDRLIGMVAVVVGDGKLPVIKAAHRDDFIHPFVDVG